MISSHNTFRSGIRKLTTAFSTWADPVRLPPAGGTSALGVPKEQATNMHEGKLKKRGKCFNPEGFVGECGEINLKMNIYMHPPPDTDTCTEYSTLKEMLADRSQGAGSQMLGYPNNFQRHLNGGLVRYLLAWLSFASQCGRRILATVNNTNVWLFTHLTFVELHLTAGEGADQHVDASCYEAVISHAVVYAVDSMRRVWTAKRRGSNHVPKIL